jgi:pimeloyl-ACP methyl ester carboxylesterase
MINRPVLDILRQWLCTLGALLCAAGTTLAQELSTPGAAPAGSPVAVTPALPLLQAVQRTHASRFDVPAAHAVDIARAVLPYAALATEVYCYLRSDETRPFEKRRDEDCPSEEMHHDHGWQRLAVYPTNTLPPKHLSDRGLRFAVYFMDMGPDQPVTLAVAFRGTEFSSWSDWHSNLHWFLPGRDQYQVLRDITHQVIADSKAQVQRTLQRPVAQWLVVTTGHSLGGGLAQLMAYKSREVQAAIVFDPSPVTGYYTCVQDEEVNCNVPVWRVYARGEVLSYVRSMLRKGYQLSENITELEFDGVGGNIVSKHSMPAFYRLLGRAEQDTPSPAWPASTLFARTSDCGCIAQRQSADWQQHQQRCAQAWADLVPTEADWLAAREDGLRADALQRRLQRLPPLQAQTRQLSQR